MGLQMLTLAQVWLVLELTHDPVQVGLVSALQGLPVIALALVAGMIADRYPKRRILLVAYTAVVLLALAMGLLALTGAALGLMAVPVPWPLSADELIRRRWPEWTRRTSLQRPVRQS